MDMVTAAVDGFIFLHVMVMATDYGLKRHQ